MSLTLSTKIIFMGVCGSGKTTLAERTAHHLNGAPIIEADTCHPTANREKMRSGVPLTDEDRWPWLDALNLAMRESTAPFVVVTCSALRRVYRERVAQGLQGGVLFFLLDAPREVLAKRLTARKHEYMPPTLLESQLATLERPDSDECAHIISVAGSEEASFQEIVNVLDKLRRIDNQERS